MPFTLIKGRFYVKGYQPDGDSIKFKADDLDNWNKLDGPKAKLNSKGHAQLRFEGIDTLETHYQGTHQPLAFADGATDFLLDILGVTNVVWAEKRKKVVDAQDGSEGYVLSKAVEGYGRPVAFVFQGQLDKPDGESVYLDVNHLMKSVNYELLSEGHAYPTYYNGLFADLRTSMTEAVASARSKGIGLWSEDKTNDGFDVDSVSIIRDKIVILPKLFRRIVSYLDNDGSISGFDTYLASNPEQIMVLSKNHFTHFDNIVTVKGNRVQLTEPPENLVFIK